jgi:AraC-like DNA-binding protein
MYDYCSFSTDDAQLKGSLLKIVELHGSPRERVWRNEAIPRLVSELYEQIDSEGEYKERLLSSLLEELTIRIIRDFATYGEEKSLHRENEAQRLCYRVMSYIDAHIYELHSLCELADIMRYNYNYLSNLFRAVTSQTLAEYYRSRKLETARLLLEEGAHSITETAALLGYSSVYTFSRAFKSYYGNPPSSITRSKL